MKNKKVKGNYAFIDSQNLNISIKNDGWKLDYSKFRLYLKNKFNVVNAFIFIGYIPENENLYTDFQRWGYILVFKPIIKILNGKVKGNVDAELILHTMIEYPNYEKAIIVSNDGDFYCLVKYLKLKNKLLKLFTPNNKYSKLLKEFDKDIIRINLLKKKLEIKKKAEIIQKYSKIISKL